MFCDALIQPTVTYSVHLENEYTGLGAKTLVPKKHASSFLFSVEVTISRRKYVEVAVNDFTMHLVISK